MAGLALLGASGCHRSAGPLPPLPAEQIPAEMQRVFAKAGPEIKNLVAELDAALKSKDYVSAYQRAQSLGSLPAASKEQRRAAARALLTVTSLLQSAQAQGDQDAAALLKYQQRTR